MQTPIVEPTPTPGNQQAGAATPCLAAALDYLTRGWCPLALCAPDHKGFDEGHSGHCQSPGKRPWHGWKQLQTERPTPSKVREWWQKHPNSNVGLALGPVSGLVRVDVDGVTAEAELQKQSAGDLPPTLEFTSGKGRGLLYAIPAGVNLKTHAQGLGIAVGELRLQAKGAQTVLPPSIHPNGKTYCWLAGHHPGDLPAAPMPAWLVALMRVDEQGRRPDVPRNGTHPKSSYAQKALANETGKIAMAREGTRHTALNKGAFSLGQLIGGGELERVDVEAELFEAALRCGLPEAEAKATIRSGLDAGIQQPRVAPDPKLNGHASDHKARPADAKPGAGDDGSDGEHGDAWEGPEPEPPRNPPPAPLSLSALVAAHPTLRPPVIHGLLREGETMNVIAPPKTGKSWLVAGMSLAVATGRRWLENYDTRPGNVLLIDNELHGETLANRIPKVAAAMGIDIGDIGGRVFVQSLRGRLFDIFGLASYFDQFAAGQFRLVVLDALYRFLPPGSDENDNARMSSIYNRIDAYADRLRCCFVLIHHASKGNQGAKAVTDVGSGAGAQSRATDSHLILRPHEEKNAVVLDCACRSWPPTEPRCFRWEFPLWVPATDLDPAALAGAGAKRQAAAEREREGSARVESDAAKVLHAASVNDPTNEGLSFTSLRDASGLPAVRFGAVVTLLKERKKVHEWQGTTEAGNGARRPARMLRRIIEDQL